MLSLAECLPGKDVRKGKKMKRELVREGGVGGNHTRIASAEPDGLPHPLAPTGDSSAGSEGADGRPSRQKDMQTLKIGHTPIFSLPEISEYFGIKHLAIKDESANQFGTHKDRKSLHVVLETVNTTSGSRDEALCILTAGNAGLSLAKIAASYGVPITAFVGGNSISQVLRAQLESACETIIPLDLEERLWPSDELCSLAGANQGRRVRDVTNGVIEPFEGIVDEICQLGEEQLPDVIVLPVGGGELFLGLARGLKKHGLRTRLIGVTVRKDSAADKLYTKWNPYAEYIKKLTDSESPHCLRSLDDEGLLLDTFRWLRSSGGIQCEPSSAAAFTLLHKIRGGLEQHEKVMVINTGTFTFGHGF